MNPEQTNPKAKSCFLIKDLDTLRVMTDPLRLKIFEMLINEPLTIRQIAEKLGLSSSKLYYHVNMLEQSNLVAVVETRMVANLAEKIYRSTASCLEIDPALLKISKTNNLESGIQLLTGMLDTTRDDLVRSIQARQVSLAHGEEPRPRRVIINRSLQHLTEEQIAQFEQRVDELCRDFEESSTGQAVKNGTMVYALTVAFYPSYYYKEIEEKKNRQE